MNTPKIVSIVIADGSNRFRYSVDHTWEVLMFGTTITNHSPHYSFRKIGRHEVPEEVKKLGELLK